jgi:uncharacterized metal-binding protein YceD (DUF177 family)
MTPELSRPLAAERVGATPFSVHVEASTAECHALAARMRIPAVLALSCDFRLRREQGETIHAEGRLSARVVRVCVVTLDEFETEITEAFTIRFVPDGAESEEIDPEAEDEIPYAGKLIDLGEAAAEQLALTLDPYPRRPDATLPESEAPAPSPFAALGALRQRH